ncbi:MAG: Fur family transcriptional regulator [Sulfurovaceae bacterium]
MRDYANLLKTHGMKSSLQRLFILKSLDERGHATIDEVFEDLKKTNPSISLSAVYRNINEMEKSNMVSEIAIPKQKNRYEITKGLHSHLLCRECGKIIDVDVDMYEAIKKIENRYDCHINDQDIIFDILCAECKK